jgi:hypothetical protein
MNLFESAQSLGFDSEEDSDSTMSNDRMIGEKLFRKTEARNCHGII